MDITLSKQYLNTVGTFSVYLIGVAPYVSPGTSKLTVIKSITDPVSLYFPIVIVHLTLQLYCISILHMLLSSWPIAARHCSRKLQVLLE
jgi:hypothetical protein